MSRATAELNRFLNRHVKPWWPIVVAGFTGGMAAVFVINVAHAIVAAVQIVWGG